MSQSDWHKCKMYCRRCGRWASDLPHLECSRGKRGSLIFVDVANSQMGCDKCGETWTIENTEFHCRCGNVQRTQYVDTVLSLEAGDQIIATDGELVYVLTRTGTVVVGYREYLGIGY